MVGRIGRMKRCWRRRADFEHVAGGLSLFLANIRPCNEIFLERLPGKSIRPLVRGQFGIVCHGGESISSSGTGELGGNRRGVNMSESGSYSAGEKVADEVGLMARDGRV